MSMEDDIKGYLGRQRYASLNAIRNYLEEQQYVISAQALNHKLRELCASVAPQIGRIPDDVAADAVLQSNIYYWKPWFDSQDKSEYESEGDLIALVILAHMRAQYPELTSEVTPLTLIPLSCYKNLVSFSYPGGYELQRFVGRYFTWLVGPRREYLKGFEAERGGNLRDALDLYIRAADAGYCRARYRLVKLLIGQEDCFSTEFYGRMLGILHDAKLVYVPAACLYADLCERMGRDEVANEVRSSLPEVRFRSEWDDEVALCLAREFHRSNQHENEALDLCAQAAEHGNLEAVALLAEWNNPGNAVVQDDEDDVLSGALEL